MTEASENDVAGDGDEQTPVPNPVLRSLDVLAGTWDLHGRVAGSGEDIRGQLTREWLDGGFYLVQHVDVDYAGQRTTGAEYIGYDAENDNLKSPFYSNQGPGRSAASPLTTGRSAPTR